MLSSDFHCKENDRFRVLPVYPGLVTSNYGVHEVGVTVIPACPMIAGCTGTTRNPSVSLQ